ncbi:YjeJ family protein [Entomohabitans teleogrylli]|uniref:YjeJ family protein n=1 Tax=Entomohabitans teleogrylli TaxID=1384589 RepID=UPI00073D204D|nr:YjeJ family protein [Entomohabitans teleogrylli]
MSLKIKGLNTGILLHEEKFLALALKIRNDNEQTEIFYMQVSVLKDFLMLLQNRLISLVRRAQLDMESLRILAEKANQELAGNIPQIEMNDVQNPDPGRLITSLSASFRDDYFNLLFCLQNEQISHLQIQDVQIEFLIMAISQAMNNAGSQEIAQQITVALDFLPLYDSLFAPDNSMDYSQYQHEGWKMELFNNYILIMYRTETQNGSELLCGSVIKTNVIAGSKEAENIARLFASLSQKLSPYYSQITHIYTQPLEVEKNITPTLEQALRPLAAFRKSLMGE